MCEKKKRKKKKQKAVRDTFPYLLLRALMPLHSAERLTLGH